MNSQQQRIRDFFKSKNVRLVSSADTIDNFGELNGNHSRIWSVVGAAGGLQYNNNWSTKCLTSRYTRSGLLALMTEGLSPSDVGTKVVFNGALTTVGAMYDLFAVAVMETFGGEGQYAANGRFGFIGFMGVNSDVTLYLRTKIHPAAVIETLVKGGMMAAPDIVVDKNTDVTSVLTDAVADIASIQRRRRHFTDEVDKLSVPHRFRDEDSEVISEVLRKAACNIKGGQTVNALIAFEKAPESFKPAVLSFIDRMQSAGQVTGKNMLGAKVTGGYPSAFFIPTAAMGIWRRTSTAV